MNEKKARRQVLILASCFVAFGLWFVISPDQRFFAYENRYLQSRPTFTWDTFISGKFTTSFETYVSDQFPAREFWLQVKGVSERLLGKAENNGVFFGQDHFLFEHLNINDTQWHTNVSHLANFSDWTRSQLDTQLHVMLVPTSGLLYPERLPSFSLSDFNQQATYLDALTTQLPTANVIDLLSVLTDVRDDAIYFTTDHHWTQLGAYYSYTNLIEQLGQTALPLNHWNWVDVSDTFYGSYYAKASVPTYQPDTISAAHSASELTFTNLDTNTTEPLYSSAYLERNDQYGYFLNGTPSFGRIDNPNALTDETIIIIKDSYSHVIAPLLAEHFASVTILDTRFYNRSIKTYLQDQAFTHILFLAGTTTFNTNMQLNKLN